MNKKLLLILVVMSTSTFAGRYADAAKKAAELTNQQLSINDSANTLSTGRYAKAAERAAELTNKQLSVADWERTFEKAASRAAVITNVQINCSTKGQKSIEELVGKLSDGVAKSHSSIPNVSSEDVENSIQSLENKYAEIFSCDGAIQKAFDIGLTESDIENAILRYENNSVLDEGQDSFDIEAFEEDLDKVLSNM